MSGVLTRTFARLPPLLFARLYACMYRTHLYVCVLFISKYILMGGCDCACLCVVRLLFSVAWFGTASNAPVPLRVLRVRHAYIVSYTEKRAVRSH